MADVDEISERLQEMERETRAEWKEIIQRLSRLEAKIDLLSDSNHKSQFRQQDRWAGGLWLAAWAVGTAALVSGAVVALLGYLK